MAKKPIAHEHSRRQYPLLSAPGVATNWHDVPDDVIVDLVRQYASSGDGILFGTSKDQAVLAIRVYRNGEGYSVYSRGAEGIGEAIDRLHRYRSPRKPQAKPGAVVHPGAQVCQISTLPYHPNWSREQELKRRAEEDERAKQWHAVVARVAHHFPRVDSV